MIKVINSKVHVSAIFSQHSEMMEYRRDIMMEKANGKSHDVARYTNLQLIVV